MTQLGSSNSTTETNMTRSFVSLIHDWTPAGSELTAAARLFLMDGLSVAFYSRRLINQRKRLRQAISTKS